MFAYGEYVYSAHRYSWLTEWAPQACGPPFWNGVGCTVSPWVTVQRPGVVWTGVKCDA